MSLGKETIEMYIIRYFNSDIKLYNNFMHTLLSPVIRQDRFRIR